MYLFGLCCLFIIVTLFLLACTDDCTNIEYLKFDSGVSFSIENKLLKQFALKFKNLKRLHFDFHFKCDPYVLLLWKLFNQMNDNHNSIQVELEIDCYLEEKNLEYNKLCQYIEQEHLKISKIQIKFSQHTSKNKYTQQLINHKHLKQLTFNCVYDRNGEKLREIINYMSNTYSSTLNTNETNKTNKTNKMYKSLNSIKIAKRTAPINIADINLFLSMKLIVDKQLWYDNINLLIYLYICI